MDLRYDGAGLYGWAKQPGLATVERALEEALLRVIGEAPSLTVAGRTDAGVHAYRQVVSLDLPPEVDPSGLLYSLNALTPAQISIFGLKRAEPGFDARRQALSRSYRFLVWLSPSQNPFLRNHTWWLRGPLDRGAMADAAEALVGRHDLTAFTPTETEHRHFTRSILRCRWRSRGQLLWLEVEAPAFLRHMVRTLVGTMVEIGRGRRTLADFLELLEGAPRDVAGVTAPAHGLFLWRIRYAGGELAPDQVSGGTSIDATGAFPGGTSP